MKSLITLLTLAVVAAAPVTTAQTISSNLMQSLSIDQLERHAGIITVSPGYLTELEFDEQVLEIFTGNGSLFKIEVPKSSPGTVMLRPTALTGRTDLKVITETGRTANFVLNIKRGTTGMVYQVKNPSAPSQDAASPDTLEASPVVAATPPSRFASTTTPMAASAIPTASSAGSLDNVDLVTQVNLDAKGGLSVFFTLTNSGTSSLEVLSVRPFDGTSAMASTVSDLQNLLDAGSQSTARLALRSLPKGKLTVEVAVRQGGVVRTLKRVVDVAGLAGLARASRF